MLDFSVMQNTDRMLTEEKAIRSRDITINMIRSQVKPFKDR